MGFYVNLEMPKNCPMCPFAHYDDMFNTFRGCDITRGKRWAVKNDKDYAKLSTRPDWCPLVEIPEPHGRLGDLDALRAKMYHEAFETDTPMQKWDSGCWIRYKMFEDMEESAPTVIPESKEG